MASAGLGSRVLRLEGRASEAGLRWMAARDGGANHADVAELYRELRIVSRLVVLRLGPRRDTRAIAELLAERYGQDPDAVEATLRDGRARRERGGIE